MRLAATFLLCSSVSVFAAGSDATAPPPPPDCTGGQVLETDSNSCVDAQDSRLGDQERYEAVREYAYDEAFDDALTVLDAMQDQKADGVLTYRGYIARKTGDLPAAMTWYEQALETNPDNLLARSYMGQTLVLLGKPLEAEEQLNEIIARGGTGTWAETSLSKSLATGETFSY
ncbi:Tetratricopeptide repeat protein [Pelagimonas phthalicica]|uniref:Tetratricopeptide repeat protein n=1 Tax=Pelagimonas phthalicica TaxID=1037362 RepID=A0A238JDW2_9RHOB|nr:tetratricopeptide repeat protein [Pelagimonas phthalicica]TDS91831.1 TPR repeat protein [Pelagimonas phthalicica]SMX28881.1 Tetratricopeptide repeat protein [Pelagimonas phthalicica]